MRTVRIISITAVFLVALLAAGATLFQQQKHQLTKTAEDNLQSVAHLKVHEISMWLHERLGDASALSESPFLADAVEALIDNPTPLLKAKMNARLTSLIHNYDYENASIIDLSGKSILSAGPDKPVMDTEENKALAIAVKTAKPAMSDIHISKETGKPHISIIAPIKKSSASGGDVVAAIALDVDPEQYLYPLVQTWPLPAKTAETLLVHRDGKNVLFLNELRHQKGSAMKLRIPLTQKDLPATMAVLGKQGLFEGRDYRGVKVLTALDAIPGTDWKMVSKIDEEEALSGWRSRSMLILGLMAALAAGMIATAGMSLQRAGRQHYKEMFLAEEKLRKTEEGYRVTLMCIGDGVITTDPGSRVELMNPVAETLTGWKQGEAAGKPLEEIFVIVNEETRDKVDNPALRAAKEGIITGLANHTLLISRDGSERPIADSAAPIRSVSGAITGAVLVFRDQTEERTAQRDIELSHKELTSATRDLLEAQEVGRLGSYVFDMKADKWTSSEQLDKIFGIDDKFVRTTENWVSIVHPSWRDTMHRYLLEEVIGGGNPFDKEYMIKRASDGAERWVHGLGRLERDAEGRPVRMIGTIQDVTDKKKSEDDMLKLRKIESVGVLAGGIAHDFNNILGAILSGVDYAMAINCSDRDECLKTLIGMKQSVYEARNLTQQLITFARGGAPVLKDASIADLLRETTSFTLRGSKSKPALDIAADIRNAAMDPGQISQVVQNLLMNADQSMPEGGVINISARNAAPADGILPPGDYIQVRVEDQGIGIPPEHLPKIFDPYFTTKQKGHGLGLATAFSIIKRHGGRISAYSELGKGSSFAFWLPATESTQESAMAMARASAAAQPGDGVRVLIMDDNEEMTEKIAQLLRRNQYDTLVAPDGERAIEMYKQASGEGKPFHIAVLDLTIPGGMGGIQTITALRQFDPEVKAIVASGYANEPALADPHAYGFHASLSKPYMFSELAEAINRVLGRKK